MTDVFMLDLKNAFLFNGWPKRNLRRLVNDCALVALAINHDTVWDASNKRAEEEAAANGFRVNSRAHNALLAGELIEALSYQIDATFGGAERARLFAVTLLAKHKPKWFELF